MVEALSREIRKLEVRLERFVTEEEGFVKELTNCLDKFRALNQHLEKVKTEPNSKIVEELVNLRLKAIEALSVTLKKGSDAEHEKSHLLESYGALVLASEKALKLFIQQITKKRIDLNKKQKMSHDLLVK